MTAKINNLKDAEDKTKDSAFSFEDIYEAEKRLKLLFDNAVEGIFILDSQGYFLSENKAMEEIAGYNKKEIIGKHFSALFNSKNRTRDLLNRIFTDEIHKYEIEIENKFGESKTVEISSSPIYNEENSGETNLIQGFMTDITKQKDLEEKIEKIEEKSNLVFRNAKDQIVLLDTSGRFLDANKSVEKYTGFKREQLIGKKFTSFPFMDKKSKLQVYKNFLKRLAGMDIGPYEIKLISKKGEEGIFDVNAGHIQEDGHIIGELVILRDITKKKELENKLIASKNQLQKAYDNLKSLDRLKNDFLNMAAHELKTPLVPIVGYVEFLLMGKAGKVNDKQKEKLQIILRNSRRLRRLIYDILDIAKIESQAYKFEMKPVLINEIAEDVVEDLKKTAEAKGLKLKLNTEDGLPPVNADIGRIHQVITNLIKNAIKFSDEGTIQVEVSENKKSGEIKVSVEDEGIGIKPEDWANLFTKFFRSEDERVRNTEGTGLGLAISKEIIDAHNGEIGFESWLGKGSEFYFTLPILKPN